MKFNGYSNSTIITLLNSKTAYTAGSDDQLKVLLYIRNRGLCGYWMPNLNFKIIMLGTIQCVRVLLGYILLPVIEIHFRFFKIELSSSA
jgi:hypothetical protein